jgi:nitrile hydratase accessory protein
LNIKQHHAMRAALPDLPFGDDGPVFREPWEAQAFAMTLALYERGVFTWQEWAHALSEAIRDAQAAGDPDHGDTYYTHWLHALENISAAKGCVSADTLKARRIEWDEAARRTPHGQPIELARTLDEPSLAAYRAAVYRIFGEPCIDMKIGSMNPHVASLMKQHDATSAVFVTAFNPFGRKLDAHENASRQRELNTYIERLKLSALNGEGFDPKHEWQPETSLFVLGATLENADMLMRAFEQNAVVHVDATGTPQLILHPIYR